MELDLEVVSSLHQSIPLIGCEVCPTSEPGRQAGRQTIPIGIPLLSIFSELGVRASMKRNIESLQLLSSFPCSVAKNDIIIIHRAVMKDTLSKFEDMTHLRNWVIVPWTQYERLCRSQVIEPLLEAAEYGQRSNNSKYGGESLQEVSCMIVVRMSMGLTHLMKVLACTVEAWHQTREHHLVKDSFIRRLSKSGWPIGWNDPLSSIGRHLSTFPPPLY